ncbi:hypothetical protein [Pinibacter soli]|uniref:MoxR-vWA-beta-propeller ternary system domain-containing protein n=1 Tax=Pinibacter soli TaxID=3044211 RepID=A0ABT6RA21_9BACT|nr:hypothetical protein [Pinibacter soli]MDI3319398.1 hypothetical protein [Pinibacter soli]
MQLRIKPYNKNAFPLKALLIKGDSVRHWVSEIHALGLSLSEVDAYPVPGSSANTVFGCFVLLHSNKKLSDLRMHEQFQSVRDLLFIPSFSTLFPAMSEQELRKLFSSSKYFIHPETGLVELPEPIDWSELLIVPVEKCREIEKPQDAVFIPRNVDRFQIKAMPPEDALQEMEDQVFPKKKEFEDKPLNLFEKGKLLFYKLLFTGKEGKQGMFDGSDIKMPAWLSKLWPGFGGTWFDKMQEDFADLEERNKRKVDKLMEMLENDPEEALRYAIPIDPEGRGRGQIGNAALDFFTRRSNFSLFGTDGRSGSGYAVDLGDAMYDLQRQYIKTAEELKRKGDYEKAAFVYMKLLKNYVKAAETLEEGHKYNEAASIYLKHANNKTKAAQCYEKGNMTMEAIELYKELEANEKVGDLYLTINHRKEANIYFEKVATAHIDCARFLKASIVYRSKMNDPEAAQSVLLKGWRAHRDGNNCLRCYFDNIADTKELGREINAIYKNDVSEANVDNFLDVIRHEYKKKNELAENIREIAYEIIAARSQSDPSIVVTLKNFNENDKELLKDAVRFKLNNKGK